MLAGYQTNRYASGPSNSLHMIQFLPDFSSRSSMASVRPLFGRQTWQRISVDLGIDVACSYLQFLYLQ